MSLTTRCSSCATVFRVVQDQLRVSEGWVRCGRCGVPFNAIEGLVDAGDAPLRVLTPETPSAPAVAAAPARRISDEEITVRQPRPAIQVPRPHDDDDDDENAIDAASGVDIEIDATPPTAAAPARAAPEPLAASTPAPAPPRAPVQAFTPPERREPAGMAAASDFGADGMASNPEDGIELSTLSLRPRPAEPAFDAEPLPLPANDEPRASELPPDSGLADEEDAAPPPFVRRAERAARWRHPAVRAALGVLALSGVLGLAGQVAYFQRDWVAATLPSLRPVLAQLCAGLGCSVGELRQIESLAVDSSGLVRIEGSALYRLSVVLRNRSNLEIAAPALDLTLTDAQGQLIARRVLAMSDLGLPVRALRPASELPIQVSLGVGDRAVAGYTVEIFYP